MRDPPLQVEASSEVHPIGELAPAMLARAMLQVGIVDLVGVGTRLGLGLRGSGCEAWDMLHLPHLLLSMPQ